MENLEKLIYDLYKKNTRQCTNEEIYNALLIYTKNQLFEKGYQDGKKKIYYISAEFLIGKLLSNNLINLGIYDDVAAFLKENGKAIADIEEVEPEPSLGNGGLGTDQELCGNVIDFLLSVLIAFFEELVFGINQ